MRVRVKGGGRGSRRHLAAQLLVDHPEDFGDRRSAALVLGEVAAHGAHAHVVRRLELRPGARRLLVVASVREHAVEALLRQPVRRGEPDPAGAARDDGDGRSLSLRGAVHCSAARAAGARQRRDEGGQAARGQEAQERETHSCWFVAQTSRFRRMVLVANRATRLQAPWLARKAL